MMHKKKIEYLEWLLNNIDAANNDKYHQVLLDLHNTVFYSLIPNDDNRSVDGLKLREMYVMELGLSNESNFVDLVGELLPGPCSVLEMLVALAARMDHILYDSVYDDRTSEWFWMLIGNLNLMAVNKDRRGWRLSKQRNETIVKTFLNREYSPSGVGGLFPLKNPSIDQRRVEIWYQMNAYINEMGE